MPSSNTPNLPRTFKISSSKAALFNVPVEHPLAHLAAVPVETSTSVNLILGQHENAPIPFTGTTIEDNTGSYFCTGYGFLFEGHHYYG